MENMHTAVNYGFVRLFTATCPLAGVKQELHSWGTVAAAAAALRRQGQPLLCAC